MSQLLKAVVTGAQGGIGRATVQRFLSSGWDVIGVDAAAASNDDESDRLHTVQADISTPDGIDAVIEAVGESLGALVNNAALQVNRSLVDTSDEEWELTVATNVGAPFRLIRSLAGALRAGEGSIVNVGSVHSVATSANVAAYAISKGALGQLSRSAALELAEYRIRCNTVAPGAVRTPMLTDGLARRPHPEGAEGNLRELESRTPLGRVADPTDIASVVYFLADNTQSAFVTGQVLVADGGATLRLGTE